MSKQRTNLAYCRGNFGVRRWNIAPLATQLAIDKYIAAELELRMSVEEICIPNGDWKSLEISHQRFPDLASSRYLATSK
ncbi:hypothetical protein CEPID_05865 [Corynebacterium epidermidicanis]|uniref:Uncharacterized protein n=1 Tax=Corynebacterium epidermidicanis TaxID=1050174 RepID=A0A0G3GVY5_9CORY|nr:hypothetical protein CEPID_05865 [Corynebacterium epidermidicanis]